MLQTSLLSCFQHNNRISYRKQTVTLLIMSFLVSPYFYFLDPNILLKEYIQQFYKQLSPREKT